MNSLNMRLDHLKGTGGYWQDRIVSEIDYLRRISLVKGNTYDDIIGTALDHLETALKTDGAIGKSAANEAETVLQPAADAAKSYKLLCASHAHIDMNWMWGWHETVLVTLETFRTVLKLMAEYPDFTFSQSQASVYKIVQDYEPEMLQEIKKRVGEGRWEVTASQWVEGDKNLPGGEALMRHLLYSRAYLSDVLSIPKSQMNIDFEPDTFGHNANMPEILSSAGVKYYYHCRGSNDRIAYRWFSPSGASVVAYQEPRWYNSAILPNLAEFVPGFCKEFGTDTALAVYGVGDHGGGPTRRDIERIIDMASWPIYPQVQFGRYSTFFETLENATLPEIRGERNFVFVGCYSSQTRIKMANRLAEAGLNEAERYAAVADAKELVPYGHVQFASAWKDTLFNHFHDILPGSGVTETREYALGKFQDTMATALSKKSQTLQAIASAVDTSAFAAAEQNSTLSESVSEGAGVGFQSDVYEISRTERGAGDVRAFTIFNPTPQNRTDCVEITVWDWEYGTNIEAVDAQGAALPFQILDSGTNAYWGHSYTTILVEVSVPGIGYTTLCIRYADQSDDSYLVNPLRTESNLVHEPVMPVLENADLKITFDPHELRMISMYDKTAARELVGRDSGGGRFRLLTEEGEKTWTAWVVGRIIKTEELIENAYLTGFCLDGPVTQWLEYKVSFASSEMSVRFQLNKGARALQVNAKVKWRELGSIEDGVPQLDFKFSHAEHCKSYTYDMPFGSIDREPAIQDRPAVSWAAAPDAYLHIVTKEKNGFRGDGDALHLPLIRATTNPDPYPEVGDHNITFWLCCAEDSSAYQLSRAADNLLQPFSSVSTAISSGTLPQEHSFLSFASDSVQIGAMKKAEDGDGVVLRLFECAGKPGKGKITSHIPCSSAVWVDADEQPIEHGQKVAIADNLITLELPPYAVRSLKLY